MPSGHTVSQAELGLVPHPYFLSQCSPRLTHSELFPLTHMILLGWATLG